MSSNFPGGHQDYFNINTNNIPSRSISMMNSLPNNHPQNLYRSPLAGILTDPSSQMGLRRPDLIGKRSLAEFQQHQQQLQLQQQASFFLRNVKQRPYNLMDFPSSSSDISSVSNSSSLASSMSSIPRYGVPVMQQHVHPLNHAQSLQSLQSVQSCQSFNLGVMGNYQNNIRRGYSSRVSNVSLPNNNNILGNEIKKHANENNQESEGKMMKQLQELEKQLLLDDEEDGENDQNDVSGVTNSEWSETIQTILGSSTPVTVTTKQSPEKPENIVSPSPTSSSSSSCASSSATLVSPKQILSDAARAISDGKSDNAVEILTRLKNVSNARGTPEQRLSFYMTEALRTRMNLIPTTTGELFGKDHILSTRLLYDKSPCFKLAFMAANATILEAGKNIHVVDFDIGQGLQYVYMLQEVAAAREAREERCEARESKKVIPFSIKLTTFQDFGNGGVERLKQVGEVLKSVANKLGVLFSFNILNLKLCDLNTTSLKGEEDEVLVVNLAFKLYKLPDESVTTENLRDEVLRRVKGLSPALVIIIEQELNGNTASFETRVGQACGYYGALLESLDATIGRDHSDRVKIEEVLSRKMINSVACEGKDRFERCEVFGKWRARMSMAGFESKAMSQLSNESFRNSVNSVTRGNPGFTVKEEGGGVSLGWMGRTLTVVSAWN